MSTTKTTRFFHRLKACLGILAFWLRSCFPKTSFSVLTDDEGRLLVSIWKVWFGKVYRDLLFEIPKTEYNVKLLKR